MVSYRWKLFAELTGAAGCKPPVTVIVVLPPPLRIRRKSCAHQGVSY